MLQSGYNFMPLLCPIEKLKESRELVICDSESSRLAHRELYHFSDEVYILAGDQDNVFDTILGMVNAFNETPATGPSRIPHSSRMGKHVKGFLMEIDPPCFRRCVYSSQKFRSEHPGTPAV